MPITQDRMLKLVSAAEHYAASWREFGKAIDTAINNMERGSDAKQELYSLRGVVLATQPSEQDAQTIAVESYHFKMFRRRNDRAKERMSHARVNKQVLGYDPKRKLPFVQRTASLQPVVLPSQKDAIVIPPTGDGANDLGEVTLLPDPNAAAPETPLQLEEDQWPELSPERKAEIEKLIKD